MGKEKATKHTKMYIIHLSNNTYKTLNNRHKKMIFLPNNTVFVYIIKFKRL